MAAAVEQTLTGGHHLLVQAGTGTGKSLGYLAPALAHLSAHPDDRVVVATATLALQAQLANSDVPAVLDAVEKVTGRRPRASLLKGRSNYACLLKVRDGVGAEQSSLFDAEETATAAASAGSETSALGAEVIRLRAWAEEQAESDGLADRDDAPAHSQAGWAQVSVPVRECLGATRCPHGEDCFAEVARERARESDLVITNHALLAIDAMHGATTLPEYHVAIIDEAHELVSRVTGAASVELSPQMIDRTAKRCLAMLDDDLGLEFLELESDFQTALEADDIGRVTSAEHPAIEACGAVRDLCRRVLTGLGKETDPERTQAKAAVQELFDIAERAADLSDHDVVWTSERERFGRWLHVAPLSVAGLLRHKLLAEHPTVLTSATLKLGGGFEPVARQVGLRGQEMITSSTDDAGAEAGAEQLAELADAAMDREGDEDRQPWRGLDVGSPFDYSKQAILYVAKHLPKPQREGSNEALLAEIAELVWAAGGRTLGLFASQRAAEAAASHVRKHVPGRTVLCQGDGHLPELTRQFLADPEVSLFGTLSLWQGIDIPGDACQLVIIDKIPFPRPDDPLMKARQDAVAEAGGNGFMAVAANHAALLLAQGAGRLIRRQQDRGVVAILDPRIVTARYGSYLRSSLPPMWQTTDRDVVLGALQRLQES